MSSCSSRSATAAGSSGWRVSRPASTPLPPYIRDAARRPGPLPDGVRGREPARRPRRRPGCTSRRSCFAGFERGADHASRRSRHLSADHRGTSRKRTTSTASATGSSRGAWERIQAAACVARCRHDDGAGPRDARPRCAPEGRTELFVTPGFEFRRVDCLVTNFHLPRTSLLALVMAFAGVEQTRELYGLAIAERYRFYSFGDAMLIRDGRGRIEVRPVHEARTGSWSCTRSDRRHRRAGPGRVYCAPRTATCRLPRSCRSGRRRR